MADNEIPAPLEDDGVPTSINGGHAASETESNSPGEKPAVPTDPTAILKGRVSRTHAILVVAEQNKAKVAASNGHPWSIGRPCLDSRGSSRYGLSLTAGLKAYGRTRLFSGDLVLVEIGRGDTVYRVTGRASRRAVAYFAKADLAQVGVELHTPCHYVVLSVVSQGGQP
jgi:hypothetical protein